MHDPTFDIPEEKPEEIYPPCDWCDGSGWTDYGKCEICDGKGYITENPRDIYPPCPNCDGTGFNIVAGPSLTKWRGEVNYFKCCSMCHGKGYIEPEEDEEIPY